MLAKLLAIALLLGNPGTSTAQEDGSPGITAPTVFSLFDPQAPACGAPQDLQRSLVFAKDNERDFIQGVDHGLAEAAEDRGLPYRVLLGDNDHARQTTQIETVAQEKVGAMVVSPIDPGLLAPTLQQVIWSGAYVGTIVPPPATSLLNAPQYLTGKELGDAAAAYIRDEFGGKANVVLLTQDSIQFLAPRFAAIRDSLKDMPGVTIVADISPSPVNRRVAMRR